MAKTKMKTKATDASLSTFLAKVDGEARRADCTAIIQMMEEAVGAQPRIWGPSIVGFGDTVLTYPNGRKLDWFVCGLASRKDALTIYGVLTDDAATETLLGKLGKHKKGKGCLYVKKLADVDVDVLCELIRRAVARKTSA